MLDLTACVVCRSVVGERLGREDVQVCNLLRSAEGLGWGDRCWDGRSYLLCMKRIGDFGIMLRCTLGGVHGDCVGDRIWSRVLGTRGASQGGRDATRLGGARGDGSSNLGSNVTRLSFVRL